MVVKAGKRERRTWEKKNRIARNANVVKMRKFSHLQAKYLPFEISRLKKKSNHYFIQKRLK